MTMDTRGPVVDSRKLHRQPGASLRLTVEAMVGDDLANDVVRVPAGPVSVEVLLESVLDGILATCTAAAPMTGDCVRCLEPLERSLRLDFRQFSTYPGVTAPDAEAGDDDVVQMTGDDLDLTDAFRDAVMLALPLTPTCRPDCPGLCPECGITLADNPGHKHEHLDPRWSELARWGDSGSAPEGE